LSVGQHILERIAQHIGRRKAQKESPRHGERLNIVQANQQSLLNALDLSRSLEKKAYTQELTHYQGKLYRLARAAREKKRSSILVFEGWDAAGKGGTIRRVTHAIDARNYQVISIAAPTDEERLHHYLWRFWRHIPRAGQVTIYDRSWYGRVLVERVEGFAGENEWMRAYSEIVNFEEALTGHGISLLKFWLHIDKDEQLKRFKEREQTPFKQYKITEDDYRNRDKWDAYDAAVNDMVARTGTQEAPWILVEANDKRYARVKILKTYCDKLEATLDGEH
jgi:polyphosphate kinase 2 (PPK2 family)